MPVIKKAADLGIIPSTNSYYPNQKSLRKDIFSIAQWVLDVCDGSSGNNNTLTCFNIPSNAVRISASSCSWRCENDYVEFDWRCVFDDRNNSNNSGDIRLRFDDDITVDEDDDEVEIEFCLSDKADGDVDIEYRTLNGTARSSSDYTAHNKTLTIDEWDRCESIDINIRDDNNRESTEYFVVEIEDVDNDGRDRIRFDDDRIRIEIRDDDRSSSSGDIELEADNETVDEDDDEVEIEFCLDEEADGDVEIEYRTASGTARSGDDYEPENDSVFIDEWDRCETIQIEIIDDSRDENTEYFTVEIEDVDNDGDDDIDVVDDTIRVTIRDDDGSGSNNGDNIDIEIDDETVDEDDDEVRLEICLSETTDEDVEVEWRTESKTARSLSDFTNTSRTTTIDEWDRCETIEIDIRDDNADESTEYFLVVLDDFEYDGNDDIRIRDDEARVTIRDDDGWSSNNGDIELEADDETVDEDDDEVEIEFCLDDEADGDVEIEYRTRDGSARSSSDYDFTHDTVTIDEWDRCETVEIEIDNDSRDENTEYFFVEIEDVDNNGDDDIDVVDERIRVTIKDDDGSGSSSSGDTDLEVRDRTVDEDDDEVEIEFCLDDDVDGDVEIEYRTLSWTARSGDDYRSESGTIEIDEWDRCETIEIEIYDDNKNEWNEYFLIEIEDVDNDGGDDIDLVDTISRVTIRDDEWGYYYPYNPPYNYYSPYKYNTAPYKSSCSNRAINPPFCDLCGYGTRYDGFRCR